MYRLHQLHLFQFDEPTRSFRWSLPNRITCSVVLEKRGGKKYWYMRKSRGGRIVNLYVGQVGSLSNELLDSVASKIERRLLHDTQEQGVVLQ